MKFPKTLLSLPGEKMFVESTSIWRRRGGRKKNENLVEIDEFFSKKFEQTSSNLSLWRRFDIVSTTFWRRNGIRPFHFPCIEKKNDSSLGKTHFNKVLSK